MNTEPFIPTSAPASAPTLAQALGQSNGRQTATTPPDEQFLHRLQQLTADQLEQMRPTLVVCLGGSGQMIGANLKALLTIRFGDRWRKKIRLLAFDTTEEPFAVQMGDELIRLEPGAEFFHIGNVPVPNIRRNLERLTAIRERMGPMLAKVPPAAMRHGAKSIRLLALLALYWHFNLVYEQLRRAIWTLAGRDLSAADVAQQQQGINIFLSFSLVGGTGSGLFQDITYLVRHLFNELGEQGQFCHITGVAVLPQAFQGIPMEILCANAGAAIEELNHLMVHGNFEALYPGGRHIQVQEAPFNLFYVVDGVDERGQTWPGINEVAHMTAQAIYMQMASQLGRKGENAFDNVDDALIGRTPDGYGTFVGSFGLGHLEFPAPQVADLFARWLLLEMSRRYWLADVDKTAAAEPAAARLQPVAPAQLASTLLRDPHGGEVRLDLSQPGWLSGKRHDEVTAEATRYVREYGLARVNEGALHQIARNNGAAIEEQKQSWLDWANQTLFTPGVSLPQTQLILEQACSQIGQWLEGGRRRLANVEQTMDQLSLALVQAEKELQDAAGSLFIGRGGRVQQALGRYFEAARQFYQAELQRGILRAQRQVWSELLNCLSDTMQKTQSLAGRLESLIEQTQAGLPVRLRTLQDGGVSRFSLADEAYLHALYRQAAPEQLHLMSLSAFHQNGRRQVPLDLADFSTAQLGERLLTALGELFAAIRQKSIRSVLEERSDEMTFHARQQQLFRLATPSWSIDRTRLPEGGATLARIQVMGVPDAEDALYGGGSGLVSTHDPHRLAAFVMVAGAAPTALQQFDRYRHALEQVKSYRPMYVLPQFLAEADQARLSFALGSIFGFITNQGAYFYYQPADELLSPMRLGNGLANAIQFLESHEERVREMMERVDGQIARLGLQQAIEVLAAYYQAPPDGRTPLDELNRELKQLVRAYAEELRQVDAFSSGLRGKG